MQPLIREVLLRQTNVPLLWIEFDFHEFQSLTRKVLLRQQAG